MECRMKIVCFSNRITRDGAKKIADLLRRDTALQILELGINRIGDDGAIHIAEALALCNTNLKTYAILWNVLLQLYIRSSEIK